MVELNRHRYEHELLGFSASGQSGVSSHEDLTDIQGGISGEHNHLSNAELSSLHTSVTVVDSPTVNLTLSGQQISADIVQSGINHGSLAGLLDDDHSQYSLVNGTRAFTSVISGVTPTVSAHLATKGYVDGLVTSGAIDHGTLSGLTHDDHAQYLLLAGRSGGQTIYGSTIASQNITISSTSNSTKGKIILGSSAYDEVNNRLGVGTDAPTEKIQISSTGNTDFNKININGGDSDSGGGTGVIFSRGNVSIGQLTCYSGQTYFDFQGNMYIRSGYGGSTRLTVTSGGFFGIGKTPSVALDVLGEITASSNITTITPTNSLHVATKNYVDTLISGIHTAVTVVDSASIDLTLSNQQISAAVIQSAIDHGSISGLLDDDHTQYVLSTGRSGGQTIYGGTVSGNNLTLYSTSNAAKGKIFLGTSTVYDEVNIRLGIGTDSPTKALHIYKTGVYGDASRVLLLLESSLSGGTPTSPTSYGGISIKAGAYEWGRIEAIQTDPYNAWLNRLAFFTMNGDGNPTTERMCIDNTGKVGIGTISPSTILTVAGDTTISGNLVLTGTIGSTVGFTNTVSGVTPTQLYHLATKGYIDSVSGALVPGGITGDVQFNSAGVLDGTNGYLVYDSANGRTFATDGGGLDTFGLSGMGWCPFTAISTTVTGSHFDEANQINCIDLGGTADTRRGGGIGFGAYNQDSFIYTFASIKSSLYNDTGSMDLWTSGGEFRFFNTYGEHMNSTSPKMVLDSNGKLGIGTTVPASLLDVRWGTSGGISSTRTATDTNARNAALYLRKETTGDMVDEFGPCMNFYAKDNSGVDNLLGLISCVRIGADNSGRMDFAVANVGSTPVANVSFRKGGGIDIADTTAYFLNCIGIAGNASCAINSNVANGTYWDYYRGGVFKWQVGNTSIDSFYFYESTSSLNRLVLNASGNNDLNNNLGNGYAANFYNDGNDQNRYGIRIQCGADDESGTTYYAYLVDGDATIGTGAIVNTAGTMTFVSLSDERVKTNIADTKEKGLETINKLKVREFKKKDKHFKKVGFIAQEVKIVIPEAVVELKDKDTAKPIVRPNEPYLGISQLEMVPYLVKAVQELSTENDILKSRLDALEAAILNK